MRRLSLLLSFFLGVAGAHGDFSVQLDAGRLRIDGSTPLPHSDNISPANGGSLLLLIAANGDGAFETNLGPGSYIGGNDLILAAGGFDTSGGTDETITFFYVSTFGLTLPASDRVALRWFPQITYQDYKNGVTPITGQIFGTYNPRVSNPPNPNDNPDGGDPWLVPSGGAVRLNFFTTDSDGGGTQPPTEGYASSVVGTIPTPSPTTTPTPTPATVSISGAISYCSNPVPGPVANVTLALTGSASGSQLSDGSGNYSFSGLVNGGSYVVTPSKSARTPGSSGINTVDVVATQRHFLAISLLTGCRLTAADVSGDLNVNTVDVIAIQRFFLGLSTGIANTGKYQFTPSSRTYSAISGDQTDQNFDALVFGDVANPFVE